MSTVRSRREVEESGDLILNGQDDPLPVLVDIHGHRVDPITGRVLRGAEEATGSVFHTVPDSDHDESTYYRFADGSSVPDMMRMLRGAGFQGQKIILAVTPRPQDENPPVLPPPPKVSFSDGPYEISGGNTHRTSCGYCHAVITGKERPRGYTLQELCDAARHGCETCSVLQKAIEHFGKLIFQQFDPNKVRVQQKELSRLFKTGLLSHSELVTAFFDEYGAEAVQLDFKGPHNLAADKSSHRARIMDTSKFETITLIKKWLKKCDTEHKDCIIPTNSLLPMRVLDISNKRLKLIETDGLYAPYVTLSHCWGKTEMICMTSDNIEALKKDIPWTMLSKTFQDTVVVCWKLGFRYLWIDSLCIMQGDKRDWEYHASRMAQIFSDSQLTISATRGEDGGRGLFSLRSEEPVKLIQSGLRLVHNPVLWQPFTATGLDRDGCSKDFAVYLKRPHGLYEGKLPKEPLLKRSWVFQEQVLSPRTIHFASGELYFECKSHVSCECQGWKSRLTTSEWETRWRRAHSVLLARHDNNVDPKTKTRQAFEAYRSLIESYTKLEITQDLDRLPALSGVTFGRRDNYLAGMWESLLRECLHWYPCPTTLTNVMARRPLEWRAPSWSWASMEAPILHLEDDFDKYELGPKYVAEILEASCTPEGLDPRGRVVSGYIRVRGPLCTATVSEVGLCERKPPGFHLDALAFEHFARHLEPSSDENEKSEKYCTYAILEQEATRGRCYLDTPLVLCRMEPAEVAVGDQVTLLLLSTTTALVLKEAPSTSGAFVRVGYLQTEKETWKFDVRCESISIV